MKSTWSQQDREAAYTSLCEALTVAGRSGETLLLARLALLLAEELSDPAAFGRALEGAALAAHSGNRPDLHW